jgi:hypothetical protein
MRSSVVTTIASFVLAACGSSGQGVPPVRADSLVLERSLCLGTCPAYRLRLARDGRVRFETRNPGDSTTASDSVSPSRLGELVRRAIDAGFFTLPDRIIDDRSICVDIGTDHPTATISIFSADTIQRVEDYHGCIQASDHSPNDRLRRIRDFEQAIDSVLDSRRWIKPAAMPW